jgi:putative copper export protein
MSGVPAIALGLAVASTLPLTGHALEYRGGAVLGWLLQTTHATAAALWIGTLGGLVLLLPAQLRFLTAERRRGWLLRIGAVFSRTALAGSSVAILAGSLLAIADVESWEALVSSDYGHLLLLKLALLAAVLGLGAWNWRRAVPRLRHESSANAERRLVATAALELLCAMLVLAVTAALSAVEAPGVH